MEESPDLEAIQRAVEFQRHAESFATKFGFNATDFMIDFDLIAGLVAGEHGERFSVLRVLVRRFGGPNSRWLAQAVSQISNSRWLISIRRRSNLNRPERGARQIKFRRKMENDRIGVQFYSRRKSGESATEAMKHTISDLGLNISNRTFHERLKEFRNQARRRGYVDPSDVGVLGINLARSPKILVADVTKRGRPRK